MLYEYNVKLLKLSAIYGGNASGKTNLIKSLDFFKFIVLEKLPTNIAASYFRELENNKDKPSKFEIEFSKNESIYAYGIEILCNKRKF